MTEIFTDKKFNSPSNIGALSFIARYHKSLLILIIIAIQFFVRTKQGHPYINNGLAISWLIFSLSLFSIKGTYLRFVSTTFTGMMGYMLIDNLFFDIKHFEANDIYLISCMLSASIVFTITEQIINPVWYRIQRKELASIIMLIVIPLFLLAGRNYLDHYSTIFQYLGWAPLPPGNPFFKSDAFCLIVSSAFIFYNTRLLDRRVSLYFLLMNVSNYVDEMRYNPLEESMSEWALVILITIGWLIYTLCYVVKNRRKLVTP